MRRKFLSVVLCVCMMLTMAPFAFAEGVSSGGGGGGSSSSVSATDTWSENKTGDLTITKDNAVIDGNGMTYTNGTITVSSTNVTIKNLTFGNGASLKVNADTFTLVGCTFNSTTKIRTPVTLNVSNATVTGNSFDATQDNGDPSYYNAIEFTVNAGTSNARKLQSATLSGNTFNAAITNNYFSAYYFENNAKVTVENNTIKLQNKESNAIRISNSAHATGVEFNLNNNTYEYGTTTDTPYEGFILLQDFAKTQESEPTQEFTTFKINITNLRAPNNAKQLLYVYDDQDGIITTNQPIVKGDDTISKFIVAKIGDNLYTSLSAAISAASDGQTVTLLKNTTENVNISAEQSVAINLNGYTVTVPSNCGIELQGKLTVTGNGKITCANTPICVDGNSAELTVNDGTIESTNDYGIYAKNGGSVVVSGGTISSKNAALSGNNTTGSMNFTVKSGTLTAAQGPAIYMPGQVSLNISGGTLNGGVSLRMGQVNISGGVINAMTDVQAIDMPTGTVSGKPAYTYSGNVWFPDALYVIGGTYTSENTTYNNSLNLNITGGTFNCANGKGSAVAIYDLAKVEQSAKVDISNNAKFSTNASDRSAYQVLSLTDLGVKNPADGYNQESFVGKVSSSITGGYFTTDPSAYVASGHYTVDSNRDGYSYMVTDTAPTKAPIIVKDQTKATVSETISSTDKTKIEAVSNKTDIDGIAEAIDVNKKSEIVAASGVSENILNNSSKKIEVNVKVNVKVTSADLTNNAITFTATPVATVSVNNTAQTTTVPVSNSYLNGKDITVKLPLPEGFTPKQIKHISTDNSVEYFLNHSERGAKMFTVDNNHCAVFTITKFSTFEVSGTQTYVEPSSGGSISAPTTYAVNVNAATNGAVAADKKTASKGTTVTVTASPSKGYVVDAVKVVDKDGKDVAVTEKDGKYVFTMPASAVTVTGSFKAETPAPAALPFTDVKSGNWFYDAVKYAYAQGLMTGTSATTFAPNGTMNRAMIVTVLYRLEKSPAVTGASKFTDVPAGQWYSDAVAWAAANKIVNGYDETTFGPMNAVTREQMAAILFRYEQVKGLENVTLEENLNRFPDQNKISAYAIPALQWAVGQKIINGNADGTLDPTGTATRAQVAQIFTNLLNK